MRLPWPHDGCRVIGPGEVAGSWSVAALELAAVAVWSVLYAVAARRLGPRLERWRVVAFASGMAVLALCVISPLDALAETLFGAHMLQHVIISDVAAPLTLAGVTGAMLRPVLAQPGALRLRWLSHPFVALPLWTVLTVFWLLPPTYALQLADPSLHALAHGTFFVAGLILWSPIIEPLPAPTWFGTPWKLAYLGALWVVGLVIANVYWFSGVAFYPDHAEGARLWGISPLQDQANGGTVMMVAMMLLVGVLATTLFFKWARESELTQELVELGHDRDAVRRAIRFGRGEQLRARPVPAGAEGSAVASADRG